MDAKSDYELALKLRAGGSIARDPIRAAQLAERACQEGVVEACALLGNIYYEGDGAPRDLGRAFHLLQQACADGILSSCSHLGIMYAHGEGTEKDRAQAVILWTRACAGNEPSGCVSLGTAYAEGDGVSKDLRRAAILYQRACDAQPALGFTLGCFVLGTSYLHGLGVPQDDARAAALFKQSCDAGLSLGCDASKNLGTAPQQEGSPSGGPQQLIDSAKRGDAAAIDVLLAKGLDPDVHVDEAGETALMWAASRGHLGSVQALLANGADVNATAFDGSTPLFLAASEGFEDIVQLLVSSGADLNAARRTGSTALISATQGGHAGVVKLLLDRGADPNIASNLGSSALFYAAENGGSDIVKLLLDKGADVNATRILGGASALMVAAEKGHIDVVKILLEAGVDTEAKDVDGNTALIMAESKGHSEIVQLLRRAQLPSNTSSASEHLIRLAKPLEFNEAALMGYEIHREPHYDTVPEIALAGLEPDAKLEIPIRLASAPDTVQFVTLKLLIERPFKFFPGKLREIVLVDQDRTAYRYLGMPQPGGAWGWLDVDFLKGKGKGGTDPSIECRVSVYPGYLDIPFEVPLGTSELRLRVGSEERLLFTNHPAVGMGPVAQTSETVFTVGPQGQFPTIQAAIDAAPAGTTVEVAEGLYKGAVRVKSGVSLRGAGADRTVIESESAVTGKAVVLLEAVSNVEVRGFTVRYTGQDSSVRVVQIERSDSVVLAHNSIRDGAGFGVQVGCDGNSLVENNEITANGQTGLLVVGPGPGGDAVTIRGNRIIANGTNHNQDLGDRAGMGILSCSPFVIGNRIDGSSGYGLVVVQAPSPRVDENTVVGNGQGRDQRYGAGILIAESGGEFRRNHVARNMTDGFVVLKGSTPEIVDNEVVENGQMRVTGRGHGIKVVESTPRVGGNRVLDNSGFGVYIEGVFGGDLSSNTFSRNALGAVSPNAGSGSEALVVAKGLSFLYDIVVADGFLYWIETSAQMPGKDAEIPFGSIKRIPLAGGEVQTVLASEVKPGEPSTILTPTDLVVSGEHAYWADPFAGNVSRHVVASDGKRGVEVVDRGHFPFRVAVHGPFLVWGTFEDSGVVKRIPLEGGTTQTLASNVRGLWDLVARDDEVFWVENGDGAIRKTSFNGDPVSTVVQGLSRPQYLAVTPSHVYWSELGAGAGQGAIKRVARSGGPPQVVVSGLHPGRFVVDSGTVFWSDLVAGTVSQVAVTGAESTILASGLKTPQGLAVDPQYVYWSEETAGLIKKIRR